MPKKKSVAGKLKRIAKKRSTPVWQGPEVDGITQSMMNQYLTCKERFRLRYIEGWDAPERFEIPLAYGDMWHVCEEHMEGDWEDMLKAHCRDYIEQYPHDQNQIEKYWRACVRQFRVYLDLYAAEHSKQNLVLPEQSFSREYSIGYGYHPIVRGKFDGVLLEKKGRRKRYRLKENKAKGQINEVGIGEMLHFDIQTQLYMCMLAMEIKDGKYGLDPKIPLEGVLYNVIRRPLSGGVGSIRQRKGSKNVPAETMTEYYDRLQQVFVDNADTYFYRWDVEFTPEDTEKYQKEFLNPILMEICQNYEWWAYCFENGEDPYDMTERRSMFENHMPCHYRQPFGTFSWMDKGKGTIYDDYLKTGSTVDLVHNEKLFPEL